MTDWHKRFIKLAHEVAKWSKDPDCQVGAVVISPNKKQISYGYNGFPAGIEDSNIRLTNPDVKNQLMVHAELNAILNAQQSVAGWLLYCTKPPCIECAKAIIQAGIGILYIPTLDMSSKWVGQHQSALALFRERGLLTFYYKRNTYELIT